MAALVPSPPSPAAEFLPDPILPALARPLSIVGDHTYAALWPYVNRPGAPHPISRELVLVRDDGRLIATAPYSDPGAPPPLARQDRAGGPTPAADCLLPEADRETFLRDCFLPSRPPLPEDRLWSGAGLQRYLAGCRPDPAEVFDRLVRVLNHFVDFTGSLDQPRLMAEFFAAYLLTTWFSPAFPFLGLLWLTGDHGAGKSRLLALLARLSHLGLYLPVPPPPAALRALAGLGASLAVDDADFLGRHLRTSSWSSSSCPALLLAGRQRGALLPVALAEPGAGPAARRTRQVDISGPRLFAGTNPPHPAIARHFLVVPLVRTAQAHLAAADPADPAAWPPGLHPRQLIDDLWALALVHLSRLPPHLSLAAQAAADLGSSPSSFSLPLIRVPLLGSALQPWHALLAVASWLTSHGVTGLFDRLLGLAQAYHADRPAYETADLTVLALQALFERVSHRCTQLADAALDTVLADDLARGGGALDDDDDDDGGGYDADDANDTKMKKAVLALERNIERSE